MMNFKNDKTKRLIVGIIAGILVLCMIVPTVLAFLV